MNGHQDELDFAGTTLLSPKEHARTGDPGTSHAAAATFSRPRATSMMGQLLAVIEASDRGLTAEEAAWKVGYSAADGSWKRVSDLAAKGLITDTGITRPGVSGKAQTVWKATH